MAIDLQTYYDKLTALDQAINSGLEGIAVTAAGELLANIKNRIALDGKNSNGQLIGNYSTKPMYATPEQFDRTSSFKPKGKPVTGRKNLKSTTFNVSNRKKKPVLVNPEFREVKSMYLESGYKELRDIQGKPTDKVNLIYRGDLVPNQYQLQSVEKAVLLGFISERSSLIRKGLERKFGANIFQATHEEMAEYNKNFSADVAELTKKVLS
jgi:hypothetical protein